MQRINVIIRLNTTCDIRIHLIKPPLQNFYIRVFYKCLSALSFLIFILTLSTTSAVLTFNNKHTNARKLIHFERHKRSTL
jgi:hypothetical protein